MTPYVLDTDHVTLVQRGHPRVVKRLATVSSQDLSTTVITAEEQIRGWLKQIRRASSRSELQAAYSGFRASLEQFNSVNLLDFDEAAAEIYRSLRSQRIRIGTLDLRIAAIVLSVEGILVTRNSRDFSQVPHLHIEDWSAA